LAVIEKPEEIYEMLYPRKTSTAKKPATKTTEEN
jgi:hypothetical protein